MNELQLIEKRVEKELHLKKYTGADRIVLAEDKRKGIEEEAKTRPPFAAMTGISLLDECTDGFRKGQLVILSGPPKNGKTAMCQTFTDNFVKNGLRCLWFSYEVGYEELFKKFPMERLDFYVPNQTATGNLEWIEDKILETKVKYGVDVVFIDHLDFLRDTDVLKGVSVNMSSYIGGIVQRVKRMAVTHNVVIFLMAHIRKNKWTANELPDSEELRDSGQIAQLADFVIMVIRERDEKKADLVYTNNAILGVMENRHNGKTKKIKMTMANKRFSLTAAEEQYAAMGEAASKQEEIEIPRGW